MNIHVQVLVQPSVSISARPGWGLVAWLRGVLTWTGLAQELGPV